MVYVEVFKVQKVFIVLKKIINTYVHVYFKCA